VADLCAKSGPTVADEEFTHVNTQLFGLIDLPGNQDIPSEQMTAPFNAPQNPRANLLTRLVQPAE
jgi:hypothetical protein